jgi:hypothetical protein
VDDQVEVERLAAFRAAGHAQVELPEVGQLERLMACPAVVFLVERLLSDVAKWKLVASFFRR